MSARGTSTGLLLVSLVACNAVTGMSDFEKVSAVTSGVAKPDVVSVGRKTSCVVLEDKTLWCWGANPGVKPGTVSTKPVKVNIGDVASVAVGVEHLCALTGAGAVHCWGRNENGQLGDGSTAPSAEPKAVPSLPAIGTIVAGGAHSCAYTDPDKDPVLTYCWGKNDAGQLGDGTTIDRTSPVKVALPDGVKVVRVSTGGDFTGAIVFVGGVLEAWCWGKNDKAQCGQDPVAMPVVATPTKIPGLPQLERFYAGLTHACGRTAGDKVPWCWGANDHGQVGTNTTSSFELPKAVINAAEAVDTMYVGARHACLLKDQTLKGFCWGANEFGQFGSSPSAPKLLPTEVPYIDEVNVSMRQAEHGCRVRDGVITCFGNNDSGQLGNGTTQAVNEPVVVELR